MAQLINIRLNRVDAQPWGLRLQGGKDFGTPLVVQKVSQGSISDQAGLQPGDAVIAVNNVEAFNLRHKDAQDLIVRSGNTFELTIQRGGSTWKPHVTPTGSLPSPGQQHHYGVGPVTKTSLQHHPPPNEQHIGCGYNNSARPFNQNGSVGGGSGNVKSIVNKQYNTPVGMYSEESIAETLTAQAEVLANGVLGVNFKKNEKAYNSEGSEVLKALKESENDPREPVSSHFYWTASHAIGNYSAISSRTNTPNPYSGQQQQQQVQQQLSQQISRNEDFAASESVQRSILPSTTTDSTKTPIVQTKIVDSSSQCIAASADASQQQLTTTSSKASPPCGDCGATIVGVFVRIKDKNLHVDCFKCATCGTSLKNQGYFNINNKLYCDVHAKLAAVQSAPTGTEGYRPGLIQPNSKLTANSTISNALSSHVNGGVKSNFGGPRPFGVPTAGPRSPAMHQQSWSQPKPAPTFANNYGSHTLPRSTVGQNAPASTASSSSATATESARTESTVVVDVQKTTAVESSFSSESASTVATVVPTLSENRTAPITMTFQTLDPKDIVEPMRSTTPSLINKPPPLVPYYQQNLVCEYYGAPNSFTFDPTNPRSPSPRPDAMKPYASGPPANVLKIQAPRITTPDSLELSTSIGVPSIVTGQSGAQLLAASRQGYSTASQSFVAQPEVFHREQKGGLSIETHSTGAELNEAKKSDMQSSSMYQVGNVQVQQNRRVVEEFEHTQKSSTTEIHTSSCSGGVSELQQKIAIGAIANEYQSETYGKGFVARQARRLSETSQSSSKNVVSSYRFPQITPDITESGFPIGNKIVEPPTPTPTPILNEPVAKVAKPIAQKTSFPPPSLPKTSFAPPRLSPIPQRSALSPRVSPVPQKISFPPPIDVAAYDDQYSSSNLNANASSLTSQYQSSAYQSLTTAGPSAFLSNPNYGSTSKPTISISIPGFKPSNFNNNQNTVSVSDPTPASAGSSNKNFSQNIGAATSTPKRGRGVLNASVAPGGRIPKCGCCQAQIRGPFITALGRIWCPDHFVCVNGTCRRPLQDIGFVEEKGDLYCEYCFEQFLAPPCDKCNGKIKGDCLNAIGKHFHPECFNCTYCGKLFGNSPFFLEDGRPYCEADWNELFTTKCFACGFPVEAGDRWVEALSHNYHSQCFNCTMCKKNLEGQSFYAKAGRPYCKNHAR
ncbi:PDZ and LIM domain protein Zasp isoform X7 [Sitodiplosis mosellana]|uniref:PDZ and LIM domain protein Zasp isoform X7 n=1 Tax=Sitodiplosis mosellana TaxID=263140 RepID=UPI002443FDFA|nr:PDZ and LIM domain protein Zasp isoform X7 [Sitodiplosis mosellana]